MKQPSLVLLNICFSSAVKTLALHNIFEIACFVARFLTILGDLGADSGGGGNVKGRKKNIVEKKSSTSAGVPALVLDFFRQFFFRPFKFPPPRLLAPGSPRIGMNENLKAGCGIE